MESIIPKDELKRIIKAFVKDTKRGVSVELFCTLCGIEKSSLYKIFIAETQPMTERTQIRVSKAYTSWKNGEVAIMTALGEKWLEYRKEPKPRMVRGFGLQVSPEGIKLKIGIKNRLDYSDYSFDEQLKGR